MGRFAAGPQDSFNKLLDPAAADWVYTNFLSSLVQNNFAIAAGYGDEDNGLGAVITTAEAGGDPSGAGTSGANLTTAPASHETPLIDPTAIDHAGINQAGIDQAVGTSAHANSLHDTSPVHGAPSPVVESGTAVASDLLSPDASSHDGASGTALAADPPADVDSNQVADATGQPSESAFDLLRSADTEHHPLSSSPFSHSDTVTPAYSGIDGDTIEHAGYVQTSIPTERLNGGAQGLADPLHAFHTNTASDGIFGGEASHPQAAPAQQSGAHATAGSSAPATSASAADSSASLENAAASSDSGGVTSAAVGAGGATAAQVQQALDESGLSVNGTGIKVGVLSDSFNDLGGAAADEADGALPAAADIQVLKDLSSGGTDEGRAMMQIIHDIAPGADLAFYTADNSEQDFANGILALAAAGAKVIVDDVGYLDEPFFQNGVVAQAIQTVEAEGVTYVTAAGNEASNAYQAAFTPISGEFDGTFLNNAQSFGGGLVQTVTVNTEGLTDAVPLELQWSQPYGAAATNLEMYVFESGHLLGIFSNTDAGQELHNPLIVVGLTTGTYQIAIVNASGSNPALIKDMTWGDGLPATISDANTGTVVGHSMTPGAVTAGAVSAADTPAFGFSPNSESFSSSGTGTELLFANNGTALSSPDMLSPVAVSGIDDIATTVPGGLSDFYGTSAASASLAGVAALILSLDPNLTPAQVEQIMESTALPMANSAVSGAGLVQVDAAVAAILPNLTLDATTAQAQQGGAAVALLSAAPVITDALSTTLSSATIHITNSSSSAVIGDELFIDGQQSGTVDGGLVTVNWNGSTNTLTLTGNVSIGAYQTLLGEISYQDLGTDLSVGGHPEHTVTWTINDGTNHFSATSEIAIERAPVVTATSQTLVNSPYGYFPASALFTASDPDNDPIVTYAFEDTGNGYFVLNGVRQPHNQEIDVSAAQLSQLFYQSGPGTDTLQVRASDGTLWSNWTSFAMTGPTPTLIESDGSSNLTQFLGEYFLYSGSGNAVTLNYHGAPLMVGQFGAAWVPIAAEPVAGGYEVAWRLNGSDLYTVWDTDSSGNYLSNIPVASGTSYAIESLETTFHHDLNGDGVIGPTTTVIETDGSNSLTQLADEYFLYSSGVGPSLKYGGAPVVAGEFGNAAPIAMEPVAGGYLVAWQGTGTDLFMIWNVDSSGNYISSVFPSAVSGTSTTLESYETVFHHDLNGDGVIGIPTTVIETDGSNSLTQVGNNYYLYSNGVGPSLNFNGVPVVAGEFGNAAPIAMEPTTGGYLVAWEGTGTDLFMIWNVDSSGNYVSSAFPSAVSGTSPALESYEPVFHHDLNGDNVIGIPTTVIETDGSNSLTQVGNNYYLCSNGVGPTLNYDGAPVVAGEFGNAAPVAMEPVAGGYLVAWKSTTADLFMIWNVDSSGNYISSAFSSAVSGTSAALESYETIFHHDLNGDGVTGVAVGAGATLELPSAETGSVTFISSTGTLQLDAPSTFTGSVAGFAGDGTLSGSDHIDLTSLNFNSLVQADSTYNTSTDILQVSNGTTVDDLQFIGTYTEANFKFAADGDGGTIVYDPPAPIDISGNSTITGGTDLNGSQITVKSGAALTLNNVTAPGATITNNGTIDIANDSKVTIAAGAGQDNFVFASNFGQITISHFAPGADTLQIDHTSFENLSALSAAIHDDGHGNAVITDAAHDTITLQNVTTAQLLAHPSDFHLV